MGLLALTEEEIKAYNDVCEARFRWGNLAEDEKAAIAPIIRRAAESGLWCEVFDCTSSHKSIEDADHWIGLVEENAADWNLV